MVMPGTMWNLLDQRDQQYVANRDDKGTWRILNCWHDEMKNINMEDDIPDDHPAVTVVTEGAFLSLFKEAIRKGYDFEMRQAQDDEAMITLQDENEQLKNQMDNMKQSVQDEKNTSEKFLLIQQKLGLIDKYISLHGSGEKTNDFIETLTRIGGNEQVL